MLQLYTMGGHGSGTWQRQGYIDYSELINLSKLWLLKRLQDLKTPVDVKDKIAGLVASRDIGKPVNNTQFNMINLSDEGIQALNAINDRRKQRHAIQ